MSILERARRELEASQAALDRIVDGAGVEITIPEPPEWATLTLPAEAYEVPRPPTLDELAEAESVPQSRLLKPSTLLATDPPPFQWMVPNWFSAHPTLLSGRGGSGKSLYTLHHGVALAAAHAFLSEHQDRKRVLIWCAEDDVDELHRRLHHIVRRWKIDPATLDDWLYIDCRFGLDNALLAQVQGRPVWTPLLRELHQQCNDLHIDQLILDNIAHMFGGNENDRHQTTMYVTGIAGIRHGMGSIHVGHPAKGQGSEYSGSTAWENAVRARMYLGDRLPADNPEQDAEAESDSRVRYLCKRKSNYSVNDYVRFVIEDGVLVPDVGPSGQDAAIRLRVARGVVLTALQQLADSGITNTSPLGGPYYLPKLVMDYKLHQGHKRSEIVEAMRQLILDGEIEHVVIGKDAARREQKGLVVKGE